MRRYEQRSHHETIQQTVQTLGYLAPFVVLAGRKTVQAVKATIDRWKAGKL